MGETQLGRMQFRIMQVLWDRGRASAREITDALNEGESEPVAHSTVQTLLRQLESKGAVGHEAEGRTFVFVPRLKEVATSAGAPLTAVPSSLMSSSPPCRRVCQWAFGWGGTAISVRRPAGSARAPTA